MPSGRLAAWVRAAPPRILAHHHAIEPAALQQRNREHSAARSPQIGGYEQTRAAICEFVDDLAPGIQRADMDGACTQTGQREKADRVPGRIRQVERDRLAGLHPKAEEGRSRAFDQPGQLGIRDLPAASIEAPGLSAQRVTARSNNSGTVPISVRPSGS